MFEEIRRCWFTYFYVQKTIYRKQWFKYIFKWYFICKYYLEKSFWLERENSIIPQNTGICVLCLILISEGRTNTWWRLNYHCIEISSLKSSLLFPSCCAICVDSTEAVPVPWLWLTVILLEIWDGGSCLPGLAVSWGVNWCAQGAVPVKCWMTCSAHLFSQAGVKLSRPGDDAELIRISLLHSQGILISCKMQKLFRE